MDTLNQYLPIIGEVVIMLGTSGLLYQLIELVKARFDIKGKKASLYVVVTLAIVAVAFQSLAPERLQIALVEKVMAVSGIATVLYNMIKNTDS